MFDTCDTITALNNGMLMKAPMDGMVIKSL